MYKYEQVRTSIRTSTNKYEQVRTSTNKYVLVSRYLVGARKNDIDDGTKAEVEGEDGGSVEERREAGVVGVVWLCQLLVYVLRGVVVGWEKGEVYGCSRGDGIAASSPCCCCCCCCCCNCCCCCCWCCCNWCCCNWCNRCCSACKYSCVCVLRLWNKRSKTLLLRAMKINPECISLDNTTCERTHSRQ